MLLLWWLWLLLGDHWPARPHLSEEASPLPDRAPLGPLAPAEPSAGGDVWLVLVAALLLVVLLLPRKRVQELLRAACFCFCAAALEGFFTSAAVVRC